MRFKIEKDAYYNAVFIENDGSVSTDLVRVTRFGTNNKLFSAVPVDKTTGEEGVDLLSSSNRQTWVYRVEDGRAYRSSGDVLAMIIQPAYPKFKRRTHTITIDGKIAEVSAECLDTFRKLLKEVD